MSYTAEDVKKLSEKLDISLHEAKKRLDRLKLMQLLNEAKSVQDLKPILLTLIDEL